MHHMERVMANGKLFHARMCLGLAMCMIGLSYWLFWHSEITRSMLIRRLFSLESNRSVDCLNELLFHFDIKTVEISAPTYVRLSQPVPIGYACDGLLANSGGSSVTNFSKSELLSQSEQVRIHSIVHQLLTNFSQRNLEMFLAGGSLLGSVRHFGLFPWDADADLMILAQQKAKVRQLLIDLSASDELRFVDTERTNQHWQLGIFCQAQRGKPLSRKYGTSKLYPEKQCKTIVDFFFGHADRNRYKRQEYPYSFPWDDIYPLRLRPYGPYLVPAPRRPENFLTAVYGKDYELGCHFKYFDHRSYNCSDLRPIYPFVSHLRLPYNGMLLKVDLLVHKSNMLSLFIPQQ